MTIGERCNREVVYVDREVTVHAACKLMRHYHVGSLVVVDETDGASVDGQRQPVGIITDSDIVVEVNAMDLDPKVMTAGDIMSPDLITVAESVGIAQTIALMRLKGIRHLPVINDENHLVGIVTLDDLLVMLADELSDLAHVVSREPMRDGRTRTSA